MSALANFLEIHDHAQRSLISQRVVFIVVMIGLTLVGGAIWLRQDMRHTQWVAAERSLQNLSLGLERDIERVIANSDTSIRDAVKALALPGFDTLPPGIQAAVLYGDLAGDAQTGVTVVNARGEPIFASGKTVYVNANYTNRVWFQIHRSRPDLGLFISPPVLGKLSKIRHLALSRRVNAANGTFAGVVFTRIPAAFFQKMFGDLKLDDQSTVTLVSMGGQIIGRTPYKESDFGRDVSSSPLFALAIHSKTGVFAATSLLDSVFRLFAYRQVGSLPLILVVGFSERNIYAPWDHTAWLIGAVVLLMLMLAIGLALMLLHEFKRRDQAERTSIDRSAQLLRADALLRIIIETGSSLIYAKDGKGRMLLANDPLLKLLGKTWGQIDGKTADQFFDDPAQAEVVAANDRQVMASGLTTAVEEFFGKTGHERLWLSTKTPMLDKSGEIFGIVGISIDITERKQVEDRLRLMVNELNHRVKNTLSTVQAIVSQTLRGADAAIRLSLEGRLLALAAAHDVLTRERWESAELDDVITGALFAFGGREDGSFRASGPSLRLRPSAALALALGLHELSTNALKYGALSNKWGRVNIEWEIPGGEALLRLTWTEAGGPIVTTPAKRGFGMKLLERSLAQDLGGATSIIFDDPRGLRCVIEAPLSGVVALGKLIPFPSVGDAKEGRA